MIDLGIRGNARRHDIFPQITCLHRVEKKWAVIVDGGKIEGIIRQEFVRFRAQKELRECIFLFLARHIDALQTAVFCGRQSAGNIGAGCRLAEDHHRILGSPAIQLLGILPHHHHVFSGLTFTQLRQRRPREREQTQRFARGIETPACEGHQAIVGEVLQIIPERVGGVQVVF